jgi:hypothetical protein
MNVEDRQVLSGLFERTRAAASNPRDAEAEAFIAQNVQAQPHAPYVLAQAVLVQEQALQAAAAKIEELEAKSRELEERLKAGATSFLGGIGAPSLASGARASVPSSVPQTNSGNAPSSGNAWGRTSVPNVQSAQAQPPAPAAAPAPAMASNSGGFLKGALSTAAGVAGGVLLANSISSLFSGHHNASTSAFGSGFGAPSNANTDSVLDHKPEPQPQSQSQPQPQLTPAAYSEPEPQVDYTNHVEDTNYGWSAGDDDMTEA